jgi:hypothetical protein
MAPVIGDGNGEFEVMRCGHFLEWKTGRRQGGSTVSEANDTVKSGATLGEAEGCGWCLEVEDDQRKFGWWAKYAVGPNCWLADKKLWLRVYDGLEILEKEYWQAKAEKKKEIKTGKDFWLLKIRNLS